MQVLSRLILLRLWPIQCVQQRCKEPSRLVCERPWPWWRWRCSRLVGRARPGRPQAHFGGRRPVPRRGQAPVRRTRAARPIARSRRPGGAVGTTQAAPSSGAQSPRSPRIRARSASSSASADLAACRRASSTRPPANRQRSGNIAPTPTSGEDSSRLASSRCSRKFTARLPRAWVRRGEATTDGDAPDGRAGDPTGTRTRVTGVRGRCPNR